MVEVDLIVLIISIVVTPIYSIVIASILYWCLKYNPYLPQNLTKQREREQQINRKNMKLELQMAQIQINPNVDQLAPARASIDASSLPIQQIENPQGMQPQQMLVERNYQVQKEEQQEDHDDGKLVSENRVQQGEVGELSDRSMKWENQNDDHQANHNQGDQIKIEQI